MKEETTLEPDDSSGITLYNPGSATCLFKGIQDLYWQRSDGVGEVQRLTDGPNNKYGGPWHPSGKFLAFTELRSQTQSDIMILPMEGDEASGWKPGKPTTFLSTPLNESTPMFSPDGRWIAYVSNESGRNEIYVRPFPGPGRKWQISNGPADDPTWSRTKRELLFVSAVDLRIMHAPYVTEGDSFRAEKPQFGPRVRLRPLRRVPGRQAVTSTCTRTACGSRSRPLQRTATPNSTRLC